MSWKVLPFTVPKQLWEASQSGFVPKGKSTTNRVLLLITSHRVLCSPSWVYLFTGHTSTLL